MLELAILSEFAAMYQVYFCLPQHVYHNHIVDSALVTGNMNIIAFFSVFRSQTLTMNRV